MESLSEKLAYFEKLKAEIIEKSRDAEIDKKHLEADFQEKVRALQAEYQSKLDAALQDAKNTAEKYRRELKEWAGATEGEPADVLSVIRLMQRFMQ